MEQTQEHRKFSRVEFRITATVRVGELLIEGTVDNLSLRGMFVTTDQKAPAGQEAEIVIALNDHADNELIINGRVARVTSDGIALVFSKMDFDSYVHLKNVVMFNAGDANKIQKEMEIFLDDGQ